MKFNYETIHRAEIHNNFLLYYYFRDHKKQLNQPPFWLENKQATGAWQEVQQAQYFISMEQQVFRVKLSISLHNQLGRGLTKVFLFSGERDVRDGPWLLPPAHEPLLWGAWQLQSLGRSSGPRLASVTTFCVWWGNSLKQCESAGAVLGRRTFTALCASGKKGWRWCLGVLGLFACASLGLKGTLRKSAGVFLCCFVFFNKLIRDVWGR